MKVPQSYILISTEAILKAERMFGSEKALAKAIGVSRQCLSYWKYNTLLPYDIALLIYVVTKGEVDIDELRPDRKGLINKAYVLKSIADKRMRFISKY